MLAKLKVWLGSKTENRTLVVALGRKLQFIVENRRRGHKTMPASSALAAAVLRDTYLPTGCDLCLVIAELEKQSVDGLTLELAYACLRDAVHKNRVGDANALTSDTSREILRIAVAATSVDSPAEEDSCSVGPGITESQILGLSTGIEVREASHAEFLKALNSANIGKPPTT